MRGGGGDKQLSSAEKIMAGVHSAGHCFEMDSETPGDGNCFPRAVRQQCQRRAVGINSITDHKDLRKKVTQYMLKSEDRAVVNMRRRWEELEVRWSWQSYWRRMARDTEWVEEPFIWATAWFLERDIWIIWDTATPENLLTFFSGDRGGNSIACPGVPLIIGHHTDTHYQSLLPEGDALSNSLDTTRFAAKVNESLEKVRESHQRQSRPKRKEPPRSDHEGADVERTILNYSLEKPGVEAKRMEDGSIEYTCLLCTSQQRQIVSHMKKNHSGLFQENELEEFQGRLRQFAKKEADRRRTEKDPEGRKSSTRNRVAKHQAKRMAEDSEGSKEYNRRKQAKCVAKKNEENPNAVKDGYKRWDKARTGNGTKKYKEEGKYGHIFPCACCHTWKSRDQVVELNQQQMDKIEEKAREYQQTLQVNSFIHLYIHFTVDTIRVKIVI